MYLVVVETLLMIIDPLILILDLGDQLCAGVAVVLVTMGQVPLPSPAEITTLTYETL